MAAKDGWVKTAMAEDRMVAELLMHLRQEPHHHHAAAYAPPSSSAAAAVAASASALLPPPGWGIRQPRSRIAFRCDATSPAKRCGDSARNSPTTPLSWSAGTASSSGTADGFDDSSLLVCGSPASTSKGTASNDSGTLDIKKSRKRKTFAELKEEEGLLLKERVHLKKEIATLSATFKEQRTRNESLKRMKLDADMETTKITVGATCEPEKANSDAHVREAPSTVDHAASTLLTRVASPSRSSDSHQRCGSPEKQSTSFLLPDLNVTPSEEDPFPEASNGVSSGETLQVSVN